MIVIKIRDSLLTTSSGYTNYRGVLNLGVILLVLSNARAALENIIKYGILVDPLSWFFFLREGEKHQPSLLIIVELVAHILISLAIEKSIVQTSKLIATKEQSILFISTNMALTSNLIACLLIPPIIVYTNDTHPISSSAALMLVSIVFLKLVSYHMMNYWCRDSLMPEEQQSRTTRFFLRSYIAPEIEFEPIPEERTIKKVENVSPGNKENKPNYNLRQRSLGSRKKSIGDQIDTSSDGKDVDAKPNGYENKTIEQSRIKEVALKALAKYPDNIGLLNIIAFMIYPTLCYELEFAKTQRIRKRFLVKRVAEVIILSQMDMALIQQWIVPTVSNSLIPFRQMKFSHMLERLLKLAIPNHIIWLIWFYLFFHSLLNIVAELTKYADREFYRDWWNSESVHYFWSNWNIPVHKWCVRHLYQPLMSLGLTRCQASTAVFLVSAFFHEYLVSVPLKLFRMWAFTGMLIQLPWARFVSRYFHSNAANVAVWLSLIIGQPLCILMYYHDWYVINQQESTNHLIESI